MHRIDDASQNVALDQFKQSVETSTSRERRKDNLPSPRPQNFHVFSRWRSVRLASLLDFFWIFLVAFLWPINTSTREIFTLNRTSWNSTKQISCTAIMIDAIKTRFWILFICPAVNVTQSSAESFHKHEILVHSHKTHCSNFSPYKSYHHPHSRVINIRFCIYARREGCEESASKFACEFFAAATVPLMSLLQYKCRRFIGSLITWRKIYACLRTGVATTKINPSYTMNAA